VAGKGKPRVEINVHEREGVSCLSLNIELEQHKLALIVRLKGELDHHTADMVKARMEEALDTGQTNHIILSFKDLSFMDSSGLGVILGRYKQITAKGGRMVVCDVNPAVYRLFEMSGLFKILSIQENEKQALSSLEVVS
jgi:stage II sporulation protein AA (anti-sigma F factor antagonist)